ncbi:hypothetical protein FALCPG4_012355 [Fusarium falciforme]
MPHALGRPLSLDRHNMQQPRKPDHHNEQAKRIKKTRIQGLRGFCFGVPEMTDSDPWKWCTDQLPTHQAALIHRLSSCVAGQTNSVDVRGFSGFSYWGNRT